MKKVKNYFKASAGVIVGTGMMLAMTMSFFVPKAEASTLNILVQEDLMVGSKGDNVTVLQGLLSELGYLSVPSGIPLGYFGSLTKVAVLNYQHAQNVLPADGYFGAATKSAMRVHFAVHGWLALLGW